MGSESLIAAPLWAERYRLELACFTAERNNIEKTQILHYQGFDGHFSGLSIFQMHFPG
jgi:hypothetical protein